MRLLDRCAVWACLGIWIDLGTACRDDDTTTTTTTTGGGGEGGGGAGGGGGGTGGVGPPEQLKVLNWNVRNLYNDVIDSPGTDEELLAPAAYEAKLQAIAAVVQNLDPDVMVFAEVENFNVLADLNDLLDGAYENRNILEGNDSRGLDVGAMSKIPFDKVVSHKDESFTLDGTSSPTYRYARDAPEFHFTKNGRKIVLVGVHFRSKGPPDDADKRLAEGQHTRAIVDELLAEDPEVAVAILGDYNDLPGSPPVDAVLGSSPEFSDIAESVSSADRYTFVYQGTQELIDHHIVNPVLSAMLQDATIAHGAAVDAASDHAPMMATYLVQ